MYEEIFSGGENGHGVKVTTKFPLVERLGKNCDETVLRHMALLGVLTASTYIAYSCYFYPQPKFV